MKLLPNAKITQIPRRCVERIDTEASLPEGAIECGSDRAGTCYRKGLHSHGAYAIMDLSAMPTMISKRRKKL